MQLCCLCIKVLFFLIKWQDFDLPFRLKENLYCSTIYILYFYFLLAVGTKTLYYGTNVPSQRCSVRGIGRVFMSCFMPSCEDYMFLFHVCEPKCIVVFAVVVNHRDPTQTQQSIVVHFVFATPVQHAWKSSPWKGDSMHVHQGRMVLHTVDILWID